MPPVPEASQAQRITQPGRSPSPSNSSGSTSSKNSTGSVEDRYHTATAASKLAVLVDENRRLKRHKEMLSSELEETKRQCVELVSFLSECLKVGPDQIDRIMRQGRSSLSTRDSILITSPAEGDCNEDGAGDGGRLKLFGIWLKDGGEDSRKRVRDEKSTDVFTGRHAEEMKALGVHA